jgi:hypothetical protein
MAVTPKRSWRIEAAPGCEIFSGEDAITSRDERDAALHGSLPKILARLVTDLASVGSTMSPSPLTLVSNESDVVVGDRVVPGLTLVYDLLPDEGRVVIRRIQLLRALDGETDPDRPVGVVPVDGAYRETVAGMVGRNVPVEVSDCDTREDDSQCTLLRKPRFFEVFPGRKGGDD